MFKDDNTGQLSGARVACFALIGHYIIASIIGGLWTMWHDQKFFYLDVPVGMAGLIALLYGINKGASTTANIKGAANGN